MAIGTEHSVGQEEAVPGRNYGAGFIEFLKVPERISMFHTNSDKQRYDPKEAWYLKGFWQSILMTYHLGAGTAMCIASCLLLYFSITAFAVDMQELPPGMTLIIRIPLAHHKKYSLGGVCTTVCMCLKKMFNMKICNGCASNLKPNHLWNFNKKKKQETSWDRRMYVIQKVCFLWKTAKRNREQLKVNWTKW